MKRRQVVDCAVIFASLLASSILLSAQASIRDVDFKNFTYPRSGQLLGHDRLFWLDPKVSSTIRLTGGYGHGRSKGFSLASVSFGALTGEGVEDAVAVVHYDTGGTQQTDYIYVVAKSANGPKVLAYCFTGDRAYSGLYKVWIRHGRLIVELLDPEKQEGDCCSSGIIRTTYRWYKGAFVRSGTAVYEELPNLKTGHDSQPQ